MEAISGKKPLAKYWLHTGFLTVNGQKMSKSLGNFITIRNFLEKHPARLMRFFVLKTHYRSPIDYSEKMILQAKEELERISEFVGKLKDIISSNSSNKSSIDITLKTEKIFEAAMADDFNTPKAFATIFDLVKKGNSLILQDKIRKNHAKKILKLFAKFDKIFNIELIKDARVIKISESLALKDLIELREKHRDAKNWGKADQIREKLQKMGYEVDDTPSGPKIKKL